MAQGLWKTMKGSCNNVIHEDLSIKVYPPFSCPPSLWRIVGLARRVSGGVF